MNWYMVGSKGSVCHAEDQEVMKLRGLREGDRAVAYCGREIDPGRPAREGTDRCLKCMHAVGETVRKVGAEAKEEKSELEGELDRERRRSAVLWRALSAFAELHKVDRVGAGGGEGAGVLSNGGATLTEWCAWVTPYTVEEVRAREQVTRVLHDEEKRLKELGYL